MLTSMRTCKKCDTERPIEEFQLLNPKTGSRRWECKSCQRIRHKAWSKSAIDRKSAYQREYYLKHTKPRIANDPEYLDRRREAFKRYNERKRAQVLDHYGRRCVCCGESIDRFLTIDHINCDGVHRRKEHGSGLDFYRWIIKNNFPSDLQTLCFNCNLGRALNNGTCPHKEGSETIP